MSFPCDYLLYSFPPVTPEMIEKGYDDFAKRWIPILDEYQKLGVKFALEAHPTEIAFDIHTAHLTLKALCNHPAFGFNFDPSHFGYQHVDYVRFIYEFSDRIFHVHMKDAGVNTDGKTGILGSHLPFGDLRRGWNFRSLGHGDVNFEEIIRELNAAKYTGPLSVEWEDNGLDRIQGATESIAYIRKLQLESSDRAFDDSIHN